MQPDIKYWKQIAAFAYESFLEHGDGVVLIKEKPSQAFSSADLDKYFQYIPFDPDNEEIPLDGVAMIVKYKPEKEVILMITDVTGVYYWAKHQWGGRFYQFSDQRGYD